MGKAEKLVAAGTTSLIAEPVLALAHQGGLGVIVGLGVGAFTYAFIDSVEQASGRRFAFLERPRREPRPQHQGSSRKTSFGYRLLVGKDAREQDARAAWADDDPEDASMPEDILELGDLRPHADSVFSNRLAILGMSGAGKSNLLSVTVEELGQYDAPLILFDVKGEYVPLCAPDYLTHPRLVNASNVTPRNASEVGQKIMQGRFHVVVDLSSYRDAEAALVMIGVIDGVARWQKARPNAERIPCTLVLEEAHYWLPENESQSTIRGVKSVQTGTSLLSLLQQTWFNVAKVGRSFGMGLVVSTQRPADVDKRLISQAEWRFLLKVMEPADLKVYRSYGLAEGLAQALNPKAGEAYVIGPDGSRGVYHIRRRYSPDVAKSPGLTNIRAGSSGRSPRSRSPLGDDFEPVNAGENVPPVNAVNAVNEPAERVNGSAWPGEQAREPVNAVNAPEETEQGYTHEEETRVLLAYAEMCKAGGPVTRRALRDHLQWNNKWFTRVIKPVCDKHGIAVRES